ncbi:MAG: OsmC family protein [Alphaproteobacteria bacterium]
MVEINIEYQGDLRCIAIHQPSGTTLLTDAPKDNHGKGESFSPTDLMATALGTCIVTTMGIVAQMMKVDLTGTKVTVRKEMSTSPPRRIAALIVTIDVPTQLDDEQKQKFIKAAHACPVHQSLHPDIQKPIDFRWAA